MSTPDSEAKKKWVKEHTTVYRMKLNHKTDADIIKKLESVESKQGYIKDLIRKDIRDSSRVTSD